MKIPDIELHNISRFRAEQMGLAMLFIILFHINTARGDAFYGLRRCGNVGVDIFLLLSGVGLWFAWSRMAERGLSPRQMLAQFWRRRLVRLLPAWLLVAATYYIMDYARGGGHSQGLIDLVGDITINWDFWLHGELTFWYVPAIMALYAVAPLYMWLIGRHPMYRWLPLVAVVWCVMVEWVLPLHAAFHHLEIFWSRIPIFLIGINMGEMVRRRHTLDGQSVWMLGLIWALTFGTTLYLEQVRHGAFPLFVERMLYIPFTITTVMVLNRVLRRSPAWACRALAAVGAVSLEAYLIHIHFVLAYITPLHLAYWPTFLLTVAATMPAAWGLHWAIGRAQGRIA